MKSPRVSIRWMMLVVVLVAINFGLIRWGMTVAADDFLVMMVSIGPSFSLLALTLFSIGLGLRRRGESSSFATGYLLIGGIFSGLAVFLSVTDGLLYQMVFNSIAAMSEAISPGSSSPHAPETDITLVITIAGAMVGFALPQVIPGLIGGWLARRYGLLVVLRGRDRETTKPSSESKG